MLPQALVALPPKHTHSFFLFFIPCLDHVHSPLRSVWSHHCLHSQSQQPEESTLSVNLTSLLTTLHASPKFKALWPAYKVAV
jgi:hypothetical protein